MKVVLDTNILLLPFTDGTDLEDELTALLGAIELVVPTVVMDELTTLAGGGGSTARAAAAAIQWAKKATLEPTDRPGDDGILDVARRTQAAVATNDNTLAAEAKASGLQVVQSRGRGRLHLRP